MDFNDAVQQWLNFNAVRVRYHEDIHDVVRQIRLDNFRSYLRHVRRLHVLPLLSSHEAREEVDNRRLEANLAVYGLILQNPNERGKLLKQMLEVIVRVQGNV